MENLIELIDFLRNNDIPKIERKETTFLEISGQPHYENVISNIYAFYLNPYEKHNLEDIFISTLLLLIAKKAKARNLIKRIIYLKDFEVIREKGIEKKKRIDLLIQDKENVIIIESKIYHQLINELDDYYNSKRIQKVSEEHKIGIILTLWHQNPSNEKYINITHLEWLDNVLEYVKLYKSDETNKYITFLYDLYQKKKNLTNKMKLEDIEFFRNNVDKINQIVELKFAMRDDIILQVERACEFHKNKFVLVKIGKDKYNQNRLRYYKSNKINELVITIVFEELLTNKGELFIIVELQYSIIKKVQEKYDDIVKELKDTFNENYTTCIFNEDFKTTKKNYAHFAHIPNCKPNVYEIENLSQYIFQKINENHILEIFNKLENYLVKYEEPKIVIGF